jgi:hypothetical protein
MAGQGAHTFQFCENGAKAVTWEATSKRVTPEFFADHTVTELLGSRGRLSPASEHLRSESAIVAGIAIATLPASKVPWADLIADYDRIRDAIEGVFPDFKESGTPSYKSVPVRIRRAA